MIFSGDYKIILNRGNYVPLDTLDMKIKPGKNYQVFEVNPYLRIIEPEISVIGRKVVAKFKLEQVTSNEVYRISLFAHSHRCIQQTEYCQPDRRTKPFHY